MKSVKVAIFAVLLLLFCLISVSAEEAALSADDHVSKAENFVSKGLQFQAVAEFRKALQKDNKRPEIYGYLSVLLYNLGFVDDAIEEMRKAVDLNPDDVHLNMELGRLYFVRNNPGDAMEQFFLVLEMNPGHASAYYYLGELFLRMKEYDMAWLSAKMARRIGHKGQDLMGKLREMSEEPKVEPWKKPGKELYIRQILVNKREKAEELLKRVKEGELFEDIAAKELKDPTGEVGGFLGRLDPSDVHPDIAGELLNKEIMSEPFIVETEKGYHIVQRLVPFDFSYWEELIAEYSSSDNKKGAEEGTEPLRGKGSYLVYAGVFKTEKNAIQRTEDLKELGFPSYHYLKGTWFNVVAGRYESYKEALEAGKKIAGQGYEYYIPEKKQREEVEEVEVEVEPLRGKGPYLVYAGAFKAEKNAMQVAEDLRKLGFPSYHYPRGAWFNVVAGRYESYQEALELGKKIAVHGYEYHIPDKSGYTFS